MSKAGALTGGRKHTPNKVPEALAGCSLVDSAAVMDTLTDGCMIELLISEEVTQTLQETVGLEDCPIEDRSHTQHDASPQQDGGTTHLHINNPIHPIAPV